MSFVTGAGKINVDLIFTDMDRLPKEGEELFSKNFSLQMGGGIPATLSNLQGLGVQTKLQTVYSGDLISHFAYQELKNRRMEPVNLYQGKGLPYNITAVLLTDHQRTLVSYSDPFVLTDELDECIYRESTGAKVAQIGLGSLDMYRRLKREGAILTYDTSLREDLTLENYADILMVADFYTPNQQEALKITGTDTLEQAADVLADFFDSVIIKLDRHGCLLQEKNKRKIIPSLPCFLNRDSTGAGDAFMAGLMYGLYHGYSLEESVLFGNITGGKCVTGVGCLGATCNEEELHSIFGQYRDELLRNQASE